MKTTELTSETTKGPAEDTVSVSEKDREGDTCNDDESKKTEEIKKSVKKKKQLLKYRYCLVCKRRCPSYYAQIFTTIPSKRAQWISVLSSKCEDTKETLQTKLEEIQSKNTYICYDHFHPSQFTQCYVSRSLILSRHATPEPYIEDEFFVNRHEVKQLNKAPISSKSEMKAKSKKRKSSTKSTKILSYKTLLFKEILALPTEHLSSTEWVKLQINLELLRRIRKKSEIYEFFSKKPLYSLLIDVPC